MTTESMSSSTRAPLIGALAQWFAAQTTPLWIVGGALRDRLSGLPCHDIDLVVAGDAVALARGCAAACGGHAAVLDPTVNIARVTLPGVAVTFDIATLAGASIVDDLAERDFTINAIAVAYTPAALLTLLDDTPANLADLIDPLGGVSDLVAKRLRAASDHAMHDDPLRILRGARLAGLLDLTIDEHTLTLARNVTAELATVAPARIAAEIYAICAQPHSQRALRHLDAMGALTTLVPPLEPCRGVQQGFLHRWDVFDHILETVDSLDRVVALIAAGVAGTGSDAIVYDAAGRIEHPTALSLKGQGARILERLHTGYLEGQTRLTRLKVAAIFHDVGKPLTQTPTGKGDYRFPAHAEAGVPLTTPVIQGWQLNKHVQRYVTTTILYHMRPGQMSGPHGLADRAARHYFRDTGDLGLDIAIFSLADHLAVYGPNPLTSFWEHHYHAVAELIRRYYEEPNAVIPPRLIDGNDLIGRYDIPRGPEIQRLLDLVHSAHLDGDITTRAEAFALVEQQLHPHT